MTPGELAAADRFHAAVRDAHSARQRLNEAGAVAAMAMDRFVAAYLESEQRDFIRAMAAFDGPSYVPSTD